MAEDHRMRMTQPLVSVTVRMSQGRRQAPARGRARRDERLAATATQAGTHASAAQQPARHALVMCLPLTAWGGPSQRVGVADRTAALAMPPVCRVAHSPAPGSHTATPLCDPGQQQAAAGRLWAQSVGPAPCAGVRPVHAVRAGEGARLAALGLA
jgi:hypothetical protein